MSPYDCCRKVVYGAVVMMVMWEYRDSSSTVTVMSCTVTYDSVTMKCCIVMPAVQCRHDELYSGVSSTEGRLWLRWWSVWVDVAVAGWVLCGLEASRWVGGWLSWLGRLPMLLGCAALSC